MSAKKSRKNGQIESKPRRIEPIKLLKKYGNYNNIIEHCKTTARIALLIAKQINKNKKQHKKRKVFDLEEVKNAALLHDIDKALTLKRNVKKAIRLCEKLGIKKEKIREKKHGLLGYEILKKEGLLKYARIAKQHVLHTILNKKTRPKTLLSKLIFYADKRAGDNKVLSINERFKLWKKRYKIKGEDLKRLLMTKKELLKLEKEIIAMTGLSKKEFEKLIREANEK